MTDRPDVHPDQPEQPDDGGGTPPSRHLDPEVFVPYLQRTRWFGGKGRPFRVSAVHRLGEVPGRVPDGPWVVLHLVELTYDDVDPGAAAATELYQVPLAFYTDSETRLEHAFVGWWEEPDHGWVHAYDALHDREAMACWLRAFDEGAEAPVHAGTLRFRRLPGHDLDLESHSTLFAGEQSNSSVAFGDDAILKLFRKVTPGVNPDIEIHERLTTAGSTHVAPLYGWVELERPGTGDLLHLGMLQKFLRTATDGWDLAQTSVRNLFAEADLHADEVGGDFAPESERLGEALREIHDTLARELPTGAAQPAQELAEAMRSRLDEALPVVPELAEHADRLRRLYAAVADLGDVPVQRIHGDLHLGQTLRTAVGWKVVDFEGEPAKPLADRVLPDSRWRDVAGMLRSYDYAAHAVERLQADHVEGVEQRAFRAEEWSHRNQEHFLLAYAGGPPSAQERTLLDAYTADKAVYECVYETRNRPTWVAIPLAAVARIGADT